MIIIGSGLMAYSTLLGLREGGFKDKVTIISGVTSKYSPKFVKKGSPKTKTKKFKSSLTRYLFDYKVNDKSSFIQLVDIGGGSNFWGANLAIFDRYSLERNNINIDEYHQNIKLLLKYIPNSKISEKKYTSQRILEYINNLKDDQIKISYPHIAFDKSKCTGCCDCISECKTNSLWKLNKSSFEDLNCNVINEFITSIRYESGKYILYDSNSSEILHDKNVILAANVLSNFKLLSDLTGLSESKLYTTPSYVFGVLTNKVMSNNFFGMSNASFSIEDMGENISYGSLYDGKSITLSNDVKYSHFKLIDKILKLLYSYFILGAGFISSDYMDGYINYKSNCLIIKLTRKDNCIKKILSIKKILIKNQIIKKLIFMKIPDVGADIHYAGGVPIGLNVNNQSGEIEGYPGLHIVGGSNFQYLPPESPTLSFMTNAFSIGNKIKP
jgi:ferredoxin